MDQLYIDVKAREAYCEQDAPAEAVAFPLDDVFDLYASESGLTQASCHTCGTVLYNAPDSDDED